MSLRTRYHDMLRHRSVRESSTSISSRRSNDNGIQALPSFTPCHMRPTLHPPRTRRKHESRNRYSRKIAGLNRILVTGVDDSAWQCEIQGQCPKLLDISPFDRRCETSIRNRNSKKRKWD